MDKWLLGQNHTSHIQSIIGKNVCLSFFFTCANNVRQPFIIREAEFDLEEIGEYQRYHSLLWTAPELLRQDEDKRPLCGTQKGDVYSFSIILQEIVFKTLPYFIDEESPKG